MGKGKRLSDWTRQDYLALHKIVKLKAGRFKGIETARRELAYLHGKDVPVKGRETYKGKTISPYDAKTIRSAYARQPEPPSPRAKRVQPKWVQRYADTDLHKKLVEDYPDPQDPKKLNPAGRRYDSVGIDLYLHEWTKLRIGKETDPATLPIEAFREAWNWDIYVDEQYLRKQKKRQIRFDKASALRNIMSYAGFNPKAYKWTSTKGLKRPPKRIYLEETQLIRFIYAINEPDTLVLSRLGFEGGGRFSATSQIATTDILFELNQIQLVETKTDTYPIKPYRPCTMKFVKRYLQQFNIRGKLFHFNYDVYEKRLLEAGFRAGLWTYKKDAKGNILYEIKTRRVKGKEVKYKKAVTEGKRTTSHLMKHTFVSLGSLHGLSLETLSDITATDIGTLKKWYLGTGRKKTLAEIHGKIEYVAWWIWVDKVMDEHWIKRYEQIKGKAVKTDGIVLKKKLKPKKEKKPKVKRPFNWDRIEAIKKSKPKHPEGTAKYKKARRMIEYWKIIWEYHKDKPKMTYEEIKKKHGKEISKKLAEKLK